MNQVVARRALASSPFVAGIAGALIVLAACKRNEPPLDVLGDVPALQFTDQDNQPFTSAQLGGSPWVVDFIFTSCGGLCPKLTAHMRAIHAGEAQEGRETRFLSISVDPEADTPEVLKAYAKKHNADAANWRFVTGDFDAVRDAIQKGFRVSMGERILGKSGEVMDITHSGHFILVDSTGKIRGYYPSDNGGLAKLRNDLAKVQPNHASR